MKATFCSYCINFFTLALILILTVCPLTANEASVSGWWHTDMVRGFALYVPAGAVLVKQPVNIELLRLRIPLGITTNDMATIAVLKARETTGSFDDIDSFAAALVTKLSTENFRPGTGPASTRRTTVAGKSAIILSGQSGSEANPVGRCDIWIQLEKDDYLVLRASAAPQNEAALASLLESIATGMKFFDPEATREKLLKNLDTGSRAISSISPEKLEQLGNTDPLWYAIIQNDKPEGFARIRYNNVRYEGKPAIKTKTLTLMRLGQGDSFRAVYEDCVYCPSAELEKWDITQLIKKADNQTSQTMLSAFRQGNALLLQYFGGTRDGHSNTIKLPPGGYALPRVFMWSPATVLSLSKTAGAAFAQFNTSSETFDMRSLEIIGPQQISLGGRNFNAIGIDDTAAIGSPPTKVFVDSSGQILKMVTHDGQTIQQTTEAAINSIFAKELEMMKIRKTK